MSYELATDTWDEREKEAIKRVLNSGRYTLGSEVESFEKSFASKVGSKFAVMVNSGSSANLLGIAALKYHSRFKQFAGGEILAPAVSWSTTFYPICQAGFKLKLLDVDLNTLNISASDIESNISKDTFGVFCVNLLGNSCDYSAISEVCDSNGLIFFEDNCESLGAKYAGKYLGTFGLFGTYSTYFSHHISTIEGGVIVTDDEEFYHLLLSMRSHGWTRSLPESSKVYERGEYDTFFEQFNFILPGYNLRPIEFQGALGLEQLNKLDSIISGRVKNAECFSSLFKGTDIVIQKECGESSWFGFSMIFEDRNTRNHMVKLFRDSSIECRPIVSGNFLRNPVSKHLNLTSSASLENANRIHDCGLFIGNHHFNVSEQLIQIANLVKL